MRFRTVLGMVFAAGIVLFSGVKYIFTQLGAKQPIEMTSFVNVLLVLWVYTFLFGRFFVDLPVLPVYALRRDRENCIKGCRACARNCLADFELPENGSMDVTGDCFQCQKCIDTCPKSNIFCGIGKVKGNELWFMGLRTVILLGLCLWMGLTNLVTITGLYFLGPLEVLAVIVMRIVLTGFPFGKGMSILYSLAGGMLSFVIMLLVKRLEDFSMIGVSIVGGVFHNVGQLIVPAAIVQNFKMAYYLPVLLVSGTVMGMLIGIVGKRIQQILKPNKNFLRL